MGGLEANELLGYDLILTGYTSSLDVGRETEAAVKRVLAASSQGNKHPISSCSLAYIQYPRIYCPITTLSKPPPPTHTPPHPTPPLTLQSFASPAMYVLDPVLGDDGRFYVPQVLTEFFKNSLMPLATVITPNQFEAEILSGKYVSIT